MAFEYSIKEKMFIGLSTDTRPVVDKSTKIYEIDTGNTYIYDGSAWQNYNIKYKDLGIIIDTTNMAAGATVYSNWLDNVQWVRNIIAFYQCDQAFDIRINKRDALLIADWGADLKTGAVAASGGSWGSYNFTVSSQSLSVLGNSVRFAIKNSSASPNTYAKLKIQLMGA